MDLETGSAFGPLVLIVVPAILTGTSAVLALGTSNRLAQTTVAPRRSQLPFVARRAGLLTSALVAFYLATGLIAVTVLLGAVSFEGDHESVRVVAAAALCTGSAGVGCLVTGCGILVWETRITRPARAACHDPARREREGVVPSNQNYPARPTWEPSWAR